MPRLHRRKTFWPWCVCLVKFSCSSKFHVNIITGSRVITIFVYKGWIEIRTSEIPPSKFCSILGQLKNTKFGTNVSKKSHLILENSQVTVFTVSQLLRENQQVGGKITPSHSVSNWKYPFGGNFVQNFKIVSLS